MSIYELLIAKFRLILQKVGKTTRPFRYDLNQIPYDCTVEARNRFKGLDQIECLKDYGTGSSDENHPLEKERQNGCLRRSYK